MAEKTIKNVRREVLFPEDMHAWMKSAARRHGLSESGLIKYLVAAELTRLYGPGWSDTEYQDHPEGDQEGE